MFQSLTKYDIGKILSEKVDIHTLKTDEHAKGVFFVNSHGYLLNKLWGVKIKHQDQPTEESLFYSFISREEDGSHCVEERYPYERLKIKPKKHFLLFDTEHLRQERIKQIFEIPEVSFSFRVESQVLYDLIPDISNRREREKTIAKIKVQNDMLNVVVYKPEKNLKKKILTDQNIKYTSESPLPFKIFAVNAFTLRTVIELFICYNVITLIIADNKIMVTGEEEDIQVVIARMK